MRDEIEQITHTILYDYFVLLYLILREIIEYITVVFCAFDEDPHKCEFPCVFYWFILILLYNVLEPAASQRKTGDTVGCDRNGRDDLEGMVFGWQ